MSANTTMRWPNLRKTVKLCKPSNQRTSLRPGLKVLNLQFQQQRTTTISSAITLNYGHLQTQVPARLDHLWTRTRKHQRNRNRKPTRSVTHKQRLMRSSITDRSHRTTTQAIAEHPPTPRYLRCQKWHPNRHDSASLRNTTPVTACNPHHRQVIQHPIRHITRISQLVLSVVRAFPMPQTELLLPRDRCYLHPPV